MQSLYLQKKIGKYYLHEFINFNNLTNEQRKNLPRLSQNINSFDYLIKNQHLIHWGFLSGNKNIKAFEFLKKIFLIIIKKFIGIYYLKMIML